jgi:DNA primase
MMAIKRNAIPLLGKTITSKLLKKIISSKVKKVYIALDNDALRMALQHCEMLLSLGKKVFLVSTNEKDPAEMGFQSFLSQIQQTPELTPENLLKLKIGL